MLSNLFRLGKKCRSSSFFSFSFRSPCKKSSLSPGKEYSSRVQISSRKLHFFFCRGDGKILLGRVDGEGKKVEKSTSSEFTNQNASHLGGPRNLFPGATPRDLFVLCFFFPPLALRMCMMLFCLVSFLSFLCSRECVPWSNNENIYSPCLVFLNLGGKKNRCFLR